MQDYIQTMKLIFHNILRPNYSSMNPYRQKKLFSLAKDVHIVILYLENKNCFSKYFQTKLTQSGTLPAKKLSSQEDIRKGIFRNISRRNNKILPDKEKNILPAKIPVSTNIRTMKAKLAKIFPDKATYSETLLDKETSCYIHFWQTFQFICKQFCLITFCRISFKCLAMAWISQKLSGLQKPSIKQCYNTTRGFGTLDRSGG